MDEFSPFAWFNGQLVSTGGISPSIASHTLHYGVGVFDGIMAYWHGSHFHLFKSGAHLDRFVGSCSLLGLKLEWSAAQLEEGIRSLLAALPPADHYIRPIAFRSRPQIALTGPGDSLPADIAIFGLAVKTGIVTSLKCHVSPIERVSALAIPVAWKICAAYTNSYLVRRLANQAGFDDGLMLDRDGCICEASAANVFFIESGGLVTPALTPEIFPGITRAFLLDAAMRMGIPTVARKIRPDELPNFEGAFLVATLMELKPLSAIGQIAYNTNKHPIFLRLWEELRTAVQG